MKTGLAYTAKHIRKGQLLSTIRGHLVILSSIAFVAGCRVDSSSDDFERMMDRWTENARTNMTEETSASFRDNVVVPFIRREMPNPFSAGGKESGRPWSDRAEKVYEAGLRDVCGGLDSLWDISRMNCNQAGAIFKEGCREPFIVLLSAFDTELSANKALARLQEAEKAIGQVQKNCFLRLLTALARYRLSSDGNLAAAHKQFTALLEEWIRKGKFAADDEIPVYHIHSSLMGDNMGCLESFPFLSWSRLLEAAKAAHYEAKAVAGNGVSSSVNERGWKMLRNRHHRAFKILDEAEQSRPGRFETLYTRLWLDGDSRMGNRAHRQRLFEEISGKRLDDADSIRSFVWFNLYPRWGGDRRRSQMLKFADACYKTQRHDTMLPYFYADTMCRYVRDSATDPHEYFRSHPDVADKCIDVCMRQTTNELAAGYARLHAPFVGAAVAFYAGRYEKAAEFDPYFYHTREEFNMLFFDEEAIVSSVAAFAGAHSNLCVELQRMYDGGRWRELLGKIAEIPKEAFRDVSTMRHIRLLELNARMKVDFAEGKTVDGKVLSYFPGWWDKGWWRTDNKSWQTWQRFRWEDHVTWRARIPKNHELELVLAPKPRTDGRHVLVVSRCVYEETHHLPINRIPFVTVIWERDRTGVYVEDDYYKMFKIKPSKATWKPAARDARSIRITCDDGRVDVFVDGGADPLVSTTEHAAAIRRSPEIGFARFHGEDVKISDIAVRRPSPGAHRGKEP
ncbi:MAG: hypothetical protein IJI35_05255 [Kiritimatiellae bacterium]|nr:hypothetical protein [Kiritimatiellia bacterium]